MSKTKDLCKEIKKVFKEFVEIINGIINFILLTPTYIIGIGFTSIFAKLVGKHFLDMKLSKEKTYWSKLDLKKKPIEKYYRQF